MRDSGAAARGRGITVYALLTAMRTAARSLEIAELAVRHRDAGVVGFDIAGAEAGSPPSRHLDAFQYVARENFHITIHAGEGFGLPSIWEALQWCGAERLGHGVRIVDDIRVAADGAIALGRLAATCVTAASRWRCARRPTCRPAPRRRSPSTRSGCYASCLPGDGQHRQPADERGHPVVGVRTPCPRRSATAGRDIEWLTINAMKSAFAPFDERLQIINTVIKPGFAMAKRRGVAVLRAAR